MNNQVFYSLILVLLISGCSYLNAQSKSPNDFQYRNFFTRQGVIDTLAGRNMNTTEFRTNLFCSDEDSKTTHYKTAKYSK